MDYKKTTLKNGLRVISAQVESPAVTVMVLVETGSNYESKQENGLSHFLEHMVFKGTSNRPSSIAIAKEFDSIGAENNAFTHREATGYYAKADKKHFDKIFEVVADLYQNPTLPEAELEKERGVILQEMSMYEDIPMRKIGDELRTLLYGDTSAGRTILGLKDNIRRFKRSDFVKYRDKHYVAGRTIVAVAGDVDHGRVVREVKKHFKALKHGKSPAKPKIKTSQRAPALRVVKKKTDQTHMLLAFRAPKAGHASAYAIDLGATILGRGMSSRLWQKMREEMGACYYVGASYRAYKDHGIFIIPTGIEAKRAEEVVLTLLSECRRLVTEPIEAEELAKAKEYYLGHLNMGLETTDALADFYTEQEILTQRPESPSEIARKIKKITAQEIQEALEKVFRNENMNLAVLGNIRSENKLKKALMLK